MNLVNMLTRRDPLKRAFVTLEDGMTDLLNEEFMLPPEPGMEELERIEAVYDSLEDEAAVAPAFTEEDANRITAHAQSRLAGFAAFDEARIKSSQEITRIGEAINTIVANQNLSREFLSDCFSDIHRANDLEIANNAYAAENRRLHERVEKLEKLRARYDQLIEVLKRREAKLLNDAETMRDTLAALRLEVVEARNAIARHDSVVGEMQSTLAGKAGDAERYMRDAEMLREKYVGLTLDLDVAQKKQAETRRRYEDMAALQASDSTRLAEITARLESEEAESARLQKLNDSLEAKLVESSEGVAQLSGELAEREKRYNSENHSLKAEIQALNGRLQLATADQRDTGSELSALRSRLSDVESENHILDKKLIATLGELESQRRLNAMQAAIPLAEDPSLEIHRKQTEQMRNEIALLQETVRQLRHHDNPFPAPKHRQRAQAEVANGFTIENGKIVPEFSPPPASTRIVRSA